MSADTPRIYVASLSDYNAGRLHGVWIDLDETTTADDIHGAVQEMLAKSPEPIAEEWAIHDYERFGAIHLDEYESLETVSALGAAIAEHGDAFAAWAGGYSYRKDNPENFENAYMGHYRSREDYAAEFAESCGYISDCEKSNNPLCRYIDWEAYANDLFMDLEDAPASDGGIFVFDLNA